MSHLEPSAALSGNLAAACASCPVPLTPYTAAVNPRGALRQRLSAVTIRGLINDKFQVTCGRLEAMVDREPFSRNGIEVPWLRAFLRVSSVTVISASFPARQTLVNAVRRDFVKQLGQIARGAEDACKLRKCALGLLNETTQDIDVARWIGVPTRCLRWWVH